MRFLVYSVLIKEDLLEDNTKQNGKQRREEIILIIWQKE